MRNITYKGYLLAGILAIIGFFSFSCAMPAKAQSGVFIRSDPSQILSPVIGQTWVLNSSNRQIVVWNGSQFIQVTPPQGNFAASVNPTTSNDNTQGYQVGSVWVNTNTNGVFTCTNNTTSAAVWLQLGEVLSQTFLTSGVETATLPNSLQLVPGANITLTPSGNSLSIAASSASGTVTTTGSPSSGNLTAFSGASSITNSDLSGDITTSGTAATTLATVNSNVGSFTNANITVNGKGLVTAAANGSSGSGSSPLLQQGRIYIDSGSPYGENDFSGNTTLFFGPCPDKGNQITLSNHAGTVETVQTFSEASASVSGLTVDTPYDVYVNSTSGSTVAESFVAWSDHFTPPTRDIQDGRLVKHSSPDYLLVGAIYIDPGSAVVYDGFCFRDVSNLYNAVARSLSCGMPSGWSSANGSIVAVDGNVTPGQGNFRCMQAFAAQAMFMVLTGTLSGDPTGAANIGIGLNSTSVFQTATNATGYNGSVTSFSLANTYDPIIGENTFQMLQQVTATPGVNFFASTYGQVYMQGTCFN